MFPVPLPAPLAQLSRNRRTHYRPSYRTGYQTSPSASSFSLGDARRPSSQTSFSSLQLNNHITTLFVCVDTLRPSQQMSGCFPVFLG